MSAADNDTSFAAVKDENTPKNMALAHSLDNGPTSLFDAQSSTDNDGLKPEY